MNLKLRAIRNGLLAVLIIIAFNFFILYILSFPLMAVEILKKYFILIALLVIGFGFQVGLFTYIKHKSVVGCSTIAASGSISAISMVLCCSHYLLVLLPFLGAILGISALLTLSKYTLHFLIIGIISNFVGISIMFYRFKKGGLK